MLEFPEVISRAAEVRQALMGAVVEKGYPPSPRASLISFVGGTAIPLPIRKSWKADVLFRHPAPAAF